MWGRAQYSIFDNADPRKAVFRERTNDCVARLGALRGGTVRRVELDFEDGHVYALLHLPAGPVTGASAVILGPGMDMIKEDYIHAAERYYTSRGVVALSIEGPGQGESRAGGLTVNLTNYERAIGRYIDFLASLPEVDPQRIGMFGISMSGYTDEDAFDRELAERMPLGDTVGAIGCPVLYGIGEFDELTPLEQAIASFERVTAPKELRVYEDEFHPLGGVAAETFQFGAEWLERALNGELAEPGRDVRHYVHRDGRTTDGTAEPTWWRHEAADAQVAALSGESRA